jgi:hypothetical protein
MRPAVHPDRPLAFERLTEPVNGDEAMRLGVALFPGTRVPERPHLVWSHVAVTLVMPKREARWIVRQRKQTARFVDRDAAVIADLRPGAPVHSVLMEHR